jgi:hypothetical protein
MNTVKLTRKVSALLLAFVLAFALAGAALAADINVTTTWPNITKPSTSQYTYVMTANNSQTLSVCGADSSWTAYPFTYTQASAITWTLPYGGSSYLSLSSNSPSSGTITYNGDNYIGYFANTTVTVASNAPSGVYVVQANYGTSAVFDYTVAIQNTDGNRLASVSDIDVKFINASVSPNTVIKSVTGATVYRSGISGNGYYLNGKSQAIQNNPSAMATLDSLRKVSPAQIDDFTVDSVGAYVSAITINSTNYAATSTSPYYGWLYGVYRDGNLVGISSAVSASAFPLEDEDQVLWVYGTYSYTFPSTWS